MSLEKIFENDLKKVQKPARYIGGESGIIVKEHKPDMLKIALCFPDMYEIGMSNNALRLIYYYLNNIDNIVCERVFAPAHDFKDLLESKNIPLMSIETATPIKDFDILAFTLGSELLFTNLLYVLDMSGIDLDKTKRSEKDPVVIVGGPAGTNPAVISNFVDGAFLGEIEPIIESFFGGLADCKGEFLDKDNFKKAYRNEILKALNDNPYFWTNTEKKVKKALWQDFCSEDVISDNKPLVASIKAIQDHGVVEIMRGCPNGCRFCHAGVFYKQKREKDLELIIKEADNLVFNGGYRILTLSSLSTGDYSQIKQLAETLLERYQKYNVSLSLPSIKVNSFTLDVLETVSENKKSGLTFAVETAESAQQHSINKIVDKDDLCDIANNAKKHGWNLIKLYFMIGLPESGEDEEQSIIDYIEYVSEKTRLRMNVNIAVFIPKPHTPYQFAKQLDPETGLDKLHTIKRHFQRRNNVKISFHDPYSSYVEGILSRGNVETGELLERAYRKGAFFDAWNEFFQKEIWLEEIAKIKINMDLSYENASWNNINIGVSAKFLQDENEKSKKHLLTSICEEECDHLCGVCNKHIKIKEAICIENCDSMHIEDEIKAKKLDEIKKLVLKYKKFGRASYIGHIDLQNNMEKILVRTGLDFIYTQGFNKKPRIEIVNPLPLGSESDAEYMHLQIDRDYNTEDVLRLFNQASIEGLEFYDAKIYDFQDFKSLEREFLHTDFEVEIEPEYIKEDFDPATIEEIIEEKTEDNKRKFLIRIKRNGKGVFRIIEQIVKDGHRYDSKLKRLSSHFNVNFN